MECKTFKESKLSADDQRCYILTICQWEEQAYGKGLHRQPDELMRCCQKNGSGFVVLQDAVVLLGYADVWQLTPDFYERLKVGVIDEESIHERDILSPADTVTGLWYVGSMIVSPVLRREQPTKAALVFASLCAALPAVFKNHGPFPARLLGVGSSQFGCKLMKKWGFAAVAPDEQAIDMRPRMEKIMLSAEDANIFDMGRRA